MSSSSPLLTFAVPTYNRLECLRLLVEAVQPEIRRLRAGGVGVELLICDNASTDGTTEYLQRIADAGARIVRNPTNMGADANVINCFEQARGRHVWICGDDDLPLPGVLERVVSFLRSSGSGLLYLPADWHRTDLGRVPRRAPAQQDPVRVDAMQLALRANASVTFISSWVVHREQYLALPGADPRRLAGTSLPQLEWHLELLRHGALLHAAPGHWLLARAGHTGGYALFDTFVARYHRILGEKLADQPALRDFLQDHLLRGYLPGLVWGMRVGALGTFEPVDWGKVEHMMAQAWPQRPHGRAWVRRIARWPRPLARLAMGWCWVGARLWMRGLDPRQQGAA